MRTFLLSILILILAAGATAASTARRLSLEGLVARSDAVVLGRVLETKTHRDERGRIVRSVRYFVDEYIVGAGEREIFVRLQGGVLKGVGRSVPGEIDLPAGERTLLFLQRKRTDGGSFHLVVGLSQGRFKVIEDTATGERFVTRTLGTVRLVGEVRDDLFGLGRGETSTFIPFETFVDAVRKLASK